ncbi:hypothetical protein P153DRAFT_321198 [Dothidotthia symphoricarpi CBS 119687]|uniref:DUF7598 domain-containing protein n=1 Tax=Dothidotthia symphoricarpi CBS 119687 TaxID=1392245 RepID=A0A6A6A885_9PLEO|nr:uncharacterized protein P153DRAFT_321198 [Dothidotthia symphoricarpi CBS 119687]KAF2127415.1 hypothetical protein P153DRAFT_321198 [Dothidotthia symphoricarpi CBS 119687]
MALLSAEHLAGPGYIILNVVRGLNIIALASVVASSVVMLVKTFVISKFYFFDATSHIITGLAGMFLIISECSLFRNFYARNWPLLSSRHGFVTLGCAMMVLGLNTLGNMNKQATSQESLGMPFWRLLIASGIIAIVIGFFNVVTSFIFRDKSRNITARGVRSRGAMTLTEVDTESQYAQSQYDPKHKAFTITTHHTGSSSSRTHVGGTPPMRAGTPPVNCGSPQMAAQNNDPNRLSQFNFSPIRAFHNARQSFLPSYHSTAPTKPSIFGRRPTSSLYSRTTSGAEPSRKKFWQRQKEQEEIPQVPEISYPLNVNPQFAHLVKPNLAHHPSLRRPEADFDRI